MIIVLKQNSTKKQIDALSSMLESHGVQVNTWEGTQKTVLGLLGDTTNIDMSFIQAQEVVESVKRVQEPFKKANRKFHPGDSIIEFGDFKIGGDVPVIMAGPCSIESYEQMDSITSCIKKAGAQILRGGAFKPRTSPYAFQGLREGGLTLMIEMKKKYNIPIVTEIMSSNHLDLFNEVDIIQVGARNMQNFELLKQLGRTQKPILLKRGLSSTIEETLMSAEYIMSGGNNKVILCERGIRTYETFTRNTLDISAIPAFKHLSHLPVIIDPSHAAGIPWMVEPLSMAAIAAGADGLMIEVHNNPKKALSDGAQSLTNEEFECVTRKVFALSKALTEV